jgi:ankyrin repeat protein
MRERVGHPPSFNIYTPGERVRHPPLVIWKHGYATIAKMNAKNNFNRLTAAEVLKRYKDEDLPAFCEVSLDNVNQIGNFGERPLHVASVRGDIDEMIALLEAGAEVNAEGELGNTPLHEAVGQGNLKPIELLLSRGASPHVKNQIGDTPMDIAKSANRYDILKLLEKETHGHA